MKREFLLVDDEGRNVDVVATFDKGERGYFSLTCNSGCDHERILASATAEVREDLEVLAAVHLADRNGTPMHAIENAAYHLREHRFREAADLLNVGSDIREIYELHAASIMTLMGPSSVIESRTRQVIAQLQVVQQAKTEFERDERLRERIFAAPDRLYRAVKRLEDLLAGNEPGLSQRTALHEQKKAIAAFEKTNAALLKKEPYQLTSYVKDRLTNVLTHKVFRDAVRQYALEKCAPVWAARAEAAFAALAKPSYRMESRPDPSVDPKTFEGFCATHGIKLEVVSRGSSKEGPHWRYHFDCTFKSANGSFSTPFFMGRNQKPALGDILESLQSEFSSVDGMDRDSFLSEMGYDGSIKDVRKGEDIYATIQSSLANFQTAFGEDVYNELLTTVGDNPSRFAPPAPRM
ncbi:conserved hypothetical protein [Hyphomicrobiales bacterium]|jgi:hypothetical protein|nr:conserved hypothetical protein [Hyphomicrobiales bacterium]CAH1702370.1 conserved hypothetical protein [Hyphomicrobiales bacterium]CAI0346570.1 conserved hypothetical protein [Hyphomicrobiales bacterium]